jgi:hypothetical protein
VVKLHFSHDYLVSSNDNGYTDIRMDDSLAYSAMAIEKNGKRNDLDANE